MDTPNKTNPSSNGALWVIALSLAVIAVCLVVLVTRQQNRAMETAETPAVEPAPAAVTPASPQIQATANRHVNRPTPDTAPAPEQQAVVAEPAPATPPPVEPAPATQPIFSGGLAPLAELATNAVTLITGRVTLEGKPPPETPIHFDPQCGKLYPGPATTHFYLVSGSGGLADVFVFIRRGLEGKSFAPPVEPVFLNQEDCFFEPYVVGLMVNQQLLIRNSDSIIHNLHVDPQDDGNRGFNLAESPGQSITRSFTSPRIPVRLRCDIHPWMFAYVCVVDNPFYSVTDAQGNYSISNVPPGHYVLEAYHRKTHGSHNGLEQRVTVVEGEATTANFTIESPPSNARVAQRR